MCLKFYFKSNLQVILTLIFYFLWTLACTLFSIASFSRLQMEWRITRQSLCCQIQNKMKFIHSFRGPYQNKSRRLFQRCIRRDCGAKMRLNRGPEWRFNCICAPQKVPPNSWSKKISQILMSVVVDSGRLFCNTKMHLNLGPPDWPDLGCHFYHIIIIVVVDVSSQRGEVRDLSVIVSLFAAGIFAAAPSSAQLLCAPRKVPRQQSWRLRRWPSASKDEKRKSIQPTIALAVLMVLLLADTIIGPRFNWQGIPITYQKKYWILA